MRDLVEPLHKHIDPWAFAKGGRVCQGELLVAHTQHLGEWASATDVVSARIEGKIDGYKQSRLQGTVAITLSLACQRCLEPMRYLVEHQFDYVLIRHASQEDSVEDGSETFICADDELDIAWFIEEEILLAMPMIAKHENCQAPQVSVESVQEERLDNPFAALQILLKNKE